MILVIVFGASRLPKLGASAGRAVRKILTATRSDERIEVQRVGDERKNEPEPPVSDAELVEPSGKRDDNRGS